MKDIEGLKTDVSSIREDVHELREWTTKLDTKLDLITERQGGTIMPVFGMLVAIAAAAGVYSHELSEWTGLALIFISAVIMQRESINKLARTVFRVGNGKGGQSSE